MLWRFEIIGNGRLVGSGIEASDKLQFVGLVQQQERDKLKSHRTGSAVTKSAVGGKF